MFIKNLTLKNFRNYSIQEFKFINGVNILYGDNGQGKTNVLEALFLASMGKSFRTAHDTEMIKDGSDSLEVLVQAEDEVSKTEIKLLYNRTKQKAISLNGIYLRKMGDLMGALPCVIFSPSTMMILSSGPSERRKFVDMALCQLKPVYYYNLQQYNKILMQKNAFLRDCTRDQVNRDMLDVWNMSLAQYGASITEHRILYLNEISEYAEEYHKNISGNNEEIEIKYIASGSSESEIFYRKLTEVSSREIERKMSLIGPHKDDIDFTLTGTGDIKKYGSQGQKRTCVLSLKLGEMSILRKHNGKMPVLLLDDVMSELDSSRQDMLVKGMEKTQVFITSTELEKLKNASARPCKSFLISEGKVVI